MEIITQGNVMTILPSKGYVLTLRGSSSKDFYTQLKVPASYNPENVIEVLDKNIPVYVPVYKPETYGMTLDEIRQHIITQTKIILQEFLNENPMKYKGELYSVTSEAQSHLSSVINAAEDAQNLGIVFTPMWNPQGESRRVYSLDELKRIFIAIQQYILPFVIQQQELEQIILATTNKEQLLNMNISYYKEEE